MHRAFGYVSAYGASEAKTEAERRSIHTFFESRLKQQGYAWGDFFEDIASTGNQCLSQRPAGFKLNLALEPSDVVIINELERTFRDPSDLLQVTQRWLERDIHLHVLDAYGVALSPVSELELRMIAACVDMKRSNRSEQMKLSIARRKANGRAGSGAPPYGYKIVGKRGKRRYALCPFTRRIGKWVVEWRLAGKTWDELYWGLIRQGVRNKKGREWSRSVLRRMIVNEFRLLQVSNCSSKQKAGRQDA
jgi:DNA invertase Pin-like site-specific DNA recombinase